MRGTFDQCLAEIYERDFASGKWTGNFIKAFRPMLHLFMWPEDSSHTEATTIQEDNDPGAVVCRRVLSGSKVGGSLFSACGQRLDYLLFQTTLKERLDQLEFLDFKVEDVSQFKALMNTDIRNMTEGGHSSSDKRGCCIDFLTAQMLVQLGSLHNDVDFRYMARLKGIALNTGAVQMLPWEASLWQEAQIPNIRSSCDLPAELLAGMINVRDAARRLISTEDVTFADMKRATSPFIKTLLSLDRTFLLEYTFLCDHASNIAGEQVRASTLDLLPTENRRATFRPGLPRIGRGGGGNLRSS